MKLNAVGVSSRNIKESVEFYKLLGVEFPEFTMDAKHVESVNNKGSKLMIDHISMVKDILGVEPIPSNHSNFCLLFETPSELDVAVDKLKNSAFEIVKAPWDAFWGQRYAIVKDPDGYMVDLYAYIK